MIQKYSFDHSGAIAVGAIYPLKSFYQTGWVSIVHNGQDPSHIAVASICRGAQGRYAMLIATAESSAVVRKKLAELKQQFGISSGPLEQPPSELEAELAQTLVSLEAMFERVKLNVLSR